MELRVRNSGFSSSPPRGLTQSWAGQEGLPCFDPGILQNTPRMKGTRGVGESQVWGFSMWGLAALLGLAASGWDPDLSLQLKLGKSCPRAPPGSPRSPPNPPNSSKALSHSFPCSWGGSAPFLLLRGLFTAIHSIPSLRSVSDINPQV